MIKKEGFRTGRTSSKSFFFFYWSVRFTSAVVDHNSKLPIRRVWRK